MGVLEYSRFFGIIFIFLYDYVSSANYIIFSNFRITRDQAQYCCAKYGMSLMSVDTVAEQTFVTTAFLPVVGYSGAFWIGVFSDDTTTNAYNVKKQPFNFTKWDETSFGPENYGENGTFMFNSTVCVKGDLSNDFAWRLTDCNNTLPYVCEVTANDTAHMVDVGEQNVNCPQLLKYKSSDVSRGGNIIQNGIAYSGTHGLFTKEDKITEMGSQISAYIVTNYHDCILHCLGNVQCSEVILVSNQACLLYQSA